MDSLFKENEVVEISKVRRRKKKRESEPKFKEYNQDQMMLLPPSLEDLVAENHLVRVVNRVIEEMDIEALIKTYKGGGRKAYDPKMLLKVLIYAYLSKIYTSRQIAKALREDVNFMWLSGMQMPDFRTINNFRSGRLKKVIDKLFSSMVIFLSEKKYINIRDYFIDGTIIEANANKYSYVWGSNTKRYKEIVKIKIKELLKYIDEVNEEENRRYGDKDLEELGQEAEEITSERIKEEVKRLNEIINEIDEQEGKKKNTKKKKLKKTVEQLNKKLIPKLEKYEQQDKKLKGRGSYSKTDEDATFIRTKTNQIVPAQNVIVGSQEQLIVNYSIHQKPSEADGFIEHIKKLEETTLGKKPQRIIGDSAYGCEGNYRYIERIGIENYLKYSSFYQEQKGKNKKKRYHRDNFIYDEKEDKYYCPEGKSLEFEQERNRITNNGYTQTVRIYKGNGCKDCKLLEQCSKSKESRTIQININLEKYKKKARENLLSPIGKELRKKRNVDIETVFGNIKQNQGFKRFNLRGLDKVNVEFGLVAMAHNIKKIGLMI